MPKICCFSEQFEEIKKKLNKIKKFMGETFQNLRAQGKSVVVERQENIVIERSESNFIKRKQTITREKFRNDANLVTTPRRQDTTKHNNSKGGQQQKVIGPPIRLAKTTGKLNSRSKRSEVSFELAVLKQEIDDEIDKLKAIRRFTLQQTVNANNSHKYKSNTNKNNINNMGKQKQRQNSTIQNDRTWDQNFTEQNPTNIKYTFEKYSSEHRMKASASATTHSQYHRDEQTSCRPRMRTIGLQKNTQRSASASRKKDPVFQNSALNLKLNSIDSIPVTATTYCFDYAPAECNIGDYYNNSNQQCSKNNSNNNCCQKYCQRVLCNSKNNNGVICNQNTYSEKGKTPCTEYNYCCDEYFYNFAPCHQQQRSPPAMITRCKPTCCYHRGGGNNIRHRHSQHQNHKPVVGYHRHGSDLCTDEFYHKTFKCDDRIVKCEEHIVKSEERKRLSRSPLRRTKEKHLTKNERQRELEKAEAKAQDRKKRVIRREDKKILTTTSEEEHAAKMAELLLMGEKSKRQSRFTKKEICRLRKLLASTDDDGECDNVSGEVELDEDTKRMMEKMRIKEYKPTKPKTENKELEVDKFFEEEIAKLTTSERRQDIKKEKQYEEYIDQYHSKPVSDLNQEPSTQEEQQKTEATDYKDLETNGSPVTRNVSLSKTYTRLTSEQEQHTDNIRPEQSTTQELVENESRKSFIIPRKFSYPEEVVQGKTLPRYEPKGGATNKSLSMVGKLSFFSELSKGNNLKLAVPPENNIFVEMPPSSEESKKNSTSKEGTDSIRKDIPHLIVPQIVLENDFNGRKSTDISTPKRTFQSHESNALDMQNTLPDTIFRDSNSRYTNSYQRGNLEVDEKTIEQIVSHISPNGDFIDTSREQDETSSFALDRSAKVDYYDRDMRKMDVKQMVQPVEVKSLSSSSYDYNNPPQQQKYRRERNQQYQDSQSKCDALKDYVSNRIQNADPCGSWDKYKTQQATRKTQRIECLCEVPEFNGCPCMFDTYLSLIAYLDVCKENTGICFKRSKSQS